MSGEAVAFGKVIYLGRGGERFGPFTESEIGQMRDQGTLSSYTSIWDGASWKPLEPPPPPPCDPLEPAASAKAQAPREKPVERRPAKAASSVSGSGFEVICHDFRNMVIGHFGRLTETSCELVCEGDAGPMFNREGKLTLNILDPKSGRSMNMAARLSSVSRVKGKWTYLLSWDHYPEIIAA